MNESKQTGWFKLIKSPRRKDYTDNYLVKQFIIVKNKLIQLNHQMVTQL
jgi:hypothetical protein